DPWPCQLATGRASPSAERSLVSTGALLARQFLFLKPRLFLDIHAMPHLQLGLGHEDGRVELGTDVPVVLDPLLPVGVVRGLSAREAGTGARDDHLFRSAQFHLPLWLPSLRGRNRSRHREDGNRGAGSSG